MENSTILLIAYGLSVVLSISVLLKIRSYEYKQSDTFPDEPPVEAYFTALVPVLNIILISALITIYRDEVIKYFKRNNHIKKYFKKNIDDFKGKNKLKKHPELSSLNVLKEILTVYAAETDRIIEKDSFYREMKNVENDLSILISKLDINFNKPEYSQFLLSYEIPFNKILSIFKDNLNNNGNISSEIFLPSNEILKRFIKAVQIHKDQLMELEYLTKKEIQERQVKELKEELDYLEKRI